jgi:hypothetical protein
MGVQQRGKDPHSWFLRYDEPVAPGQPRKRVAKTFHGTKKTGSSGDPLREFSPEVSNRGLVSSPLKICFC